VSESKTVLRALELKVILNPHPSVDDWTDMLSAISDFLCDKITTSEIKGFTLELVGAENKIADVRA